MKRLRALALTLLLDAALINLAFGLAYIMRYTLELFVPVLDEFRAPYQAYVPFQLGYTVMLLIFLAVDGAYTPRRGGSWFSDLYRVFNATTTVGVIAFAVVFFLRPLVYSRGLILWAIVLTIGLLGLARLGQRLTRAALRRRGVGVARVLIVGAGEMGRTVMRTIVAQPELGYQIVGFVDDDLAKTELGRFKSLGRLEQLEVVLKAERVDETLITLPWMYQRQITAVVRACEKLGVRARVVPDLFRLSLSQLDVDEIGGIPLVGIKEASLPGLGRALKRGLDVVVAALVLLVMGLPMLLIAALIKLETPGPALFRQTRVGERGRHFTIVKFRSMRVGAEGEQDRLRNHNEASGPLFKIKDDPRQTGVGRFIRRTSLDELPQFINVLRGEMSLVGPRPGLPQEVAQYQPWHRQRLEAPQGITGLWQVSGRSDLTFDEMCLLDIYYIENWSLGLDLQIALRTIPLLLFGRGAY
ncbi:MAG: sugar transferase [Anaerolineales bacterium]|nr:sugar transferase [Anaerolineales bacterium]